MKKLLISVLSLFTMGIIIAQDMKLDELLDKYYKASGQDKLAKINTVKMTGKMLQGGLEFLLTSYEKRPDLNKAEIEFQGTKMVFVFVGQSGWTINPVSGSMDPQDMSADMLNSSKKEDMKDPYSSWDNPLVIWKEKGYKIELVGKEDLVGTPVYNLKMTFNENESVNYYMDAAKFLILKTSQKATVQGQAIDVESIFADFKEVDGIMNQFKVETFYNSQSARIFITEKIEYNVPIDDVIFKKPEVIKK